MNTEIFYHNLLRKALLEIKQGGFNAIVFGPLKTQNSEYQENLNKFRCAQNTVQEQGYRVFDQIPYLDIYLENAPFDFKTKFPIFFEGIIKSGLIKYALFTHDWEKSSGAISEHEYCLNNSITIIYL